MDPQISGNNIHDGYLTDAISQMEHLVEQLDGTAKLSLSNSRLQQHSRQDRPDSPSDESIQETRNTPRSVRTLGTFSDSPSISLVDRMSTLTANLNVSKEEMRALLRSNAALRHKNVALSKQMQETEDKYNSLKTRLRTLRHELHRKLPPHASSEPQLKTPSVTPSLSKDNDVAIRALHNQVESLTSNLKRSEEKVLKGSDDLDLANERIRSLESEIVTLENENNNLGESVRYLNAEVEYLQAELDKKTVTEREIVTESSFKLKSVSEELRTVSSRLEEAQANLDKQVRTNEELLVKLRNSHTELLKVRKKSVNQERELKDVTDRYHALETSKESNTDEISGLRNSLRVYLGRIRKQENKIRELEGVLFEYEKRELIKAPVHVRRHSGKESERTVSPVETLHDNSKLVS